MQQTPTLDERDQMILAERRVAFDAVMGPRCGDFVRFADGVERRISYIWDFGEEDNAVQTSDGGSWYLGEGYASFSGSLYPSVAQSTLRLAGEERMGRFWFFHHDWRTAHNGVDVEFPCRVWDCSLEAPR